MSASKADPLLLEHRPRGKPVVHRRSCPHRVISDARASRVYHSELKDAAAFGWLLCPACMRPERRRLTFR